MFSQEQIVLKSISFESQEQQIYIVKVMDERPEKSLGYLENAYGEKSKLYLKPDAPQAVMSFMNLSLSKLEKSKPIYIKINNLEIRQAQTSISELTVQVYVNLEFYEKNNNNLSKLYGISRSVQQVFSMSSTYKIFKTHEQRIRAALEYCMIGFINHRIKNDSNSGFKPSNIFEKSSIINSKPKLGKWFNMLTFKRILSNHNKGWKVNYIGFLDTDDDFILPFVLSYDQYSLKSDELIKKKYKSVDTYSIGVGFDGLIKISPGIYANFGINIPIGIETITSQANRKKGNSLIGVSTKQGIKIIPWKNYGIVIGAGLFQQIQTSKVYKTDFGFELELGINF
jgi:hypothetical protein